MRILWILSGLGLLYHYLRRYKNRKIKSYFSIKIWLKENIDSLLLSVIAVISVMLIFTNKEVYPEIEYWIKGKVGVMLTQIIFLTGALTIGFLNTWLLDNIFRFGKGKIKSKLKK